MRGIPEHYASTIANSRRKYWYISNNKAVICQGAAAGKLKIHLKGCKKYFVPDGQICGKMNMVHPCRNATFGFSHDTFFYSVG